MSSPEVLVGYITRAGYTREVATAIAQRLRARGCEVDLADLELCIRHPERYDAVVLGCAVRFGHPAAAMAKFILENHRALATRPAAFFSIDGTRRAAEHLETFLRDVAWRPTRSATFVGVRGARVRRAIEWLKDRVESTSIRHVDAPTDWRRIAAFADELATSLSGESSHCA